MHCLDYKNNLNILNNILRQDLCKPFIQNEYVKINED